MVLSSSQQLVLLFTGALFVFIIFPRFFTGGSARDNKVLDPRFRKGPHPGPAPPQRDPPDSVQQVQRFVEQEVRKEKSKLSNNNKGYVFTLMPLYAIGVALFAAYKFLKIKSADDTHAQKEKTAQGLRKSEETENQLNELEQRLAQTEKMLNSILTQLDPLTNWYIHTQLYNVKSVAMEQKNEIMTQLQCIRHLMKKRGMQYAPTDASCERNLDNLIESLGAMEALSMKTSTKLHSAGKQDSGERDNGVTSDLRMLSLEEVDDDRGGVAAEADEDSEEGHDEVGMDSEENDLSDEEQGGNIGEGMAKECLDEWRAALRRRNRHE